MYGIHKVHKKNEILISLENQIVQWIRAWETCGQNSHSGNTSSSNSWTPSKMPSLTKSFPVMPPIQSLQQSPNFQKIAPLSKCDKRPSFVKVVWRLLKNEGLILNSYFFIWFCQLMIN